MAYRVRVASAEAAANGDVYLDCFIETDASGDWLPAINGHRTMVMDGAAVLAITGNDALTDQQKRAQLASLFRAEATSWGIDQADAAQTALAELVEYPVNVAI